ncbi:MAG: DUF3793 family protein [Lachnospiraceae bacterium]
MSCELIVQFCAPTLAGLKVGNLFSYRFECLEKFQKQIEYNNKLLNKKGIYFVVVKNENGLALIYVYRKSQLLKQLQSKEVALFLREMGYQEMSIESALEVLSKHLLEHEFPHEIGAFLGYPIEDIRAFMKYKGLSYKSVGHWKVYTDEEEAHKIFKKYNKCVAVYCEKLASGFDLNRLTVTC